MRSGVWSFGIDVLGIECAGVVVEDPSGALPAGSTVVALVGVDAHRLMDSGRAGGKLVVEVA